MLVGHYHMEVKFGYQGHGFKVKVIATKKLNFSLLLVDNV